MDCRHTCAHAGHTRRKEPVRGKREQERAVWLIEISSFSLGPLNAWYPVGGCLGEGQEVALMEEMSLGPGLGVSQDLHHFRCPLSLLFLF